MAKLVQIQAATELPVTLDQVKRNLRIDDDDSDDLLHGLIQAATAYFDGPGGVIGRALMPQDWELWLPNWPESGVIEVPLMPILQVYSITYLDSTATTQTLALANYSTLGDDTIVQTPTGTWPSVYAGRDDAVKIYFEAGYRSVASPTDIAVPDSIRQAIIATVSHWYDDGGTVQGIPDIAYTLVAPLKLNRLGYV